MDLGYPVTIGLAGMDFNITDGHLSPPEYDYLYTERVVRLANCFLCFHPYDDSPEVAPAPCENNGYVTFGSFNNLPKISRTTVALGMGIPVITLPGRTFCSRMGLSILRTLGKDEWIVKPNEDYIRIATELADQSKLIRQHRRELREQMLASPLCDGRRFTADFENGCRWMVDQVEWASSKHYD
jgi:predicted O-linked N-acetylglucosamine transferase (SPINDLY family)